MQRRLLRSALRLPRLPLLLAILPLAALANSPAATAPDAKPLACSVRVIDAQTLIRSRRAEEAEASILRPALQQLEELAKTDTRKFYCSRTAAETLLYLGGAATRPEIGSAVIVDYDFALAHYFSAYLRVENRDLAAAEKHIEAALSLSPANPMFLCEKAHLRQLAKDWTGAIQLCDQAIDSTAAFSPPDARVREKTRALRTKAYSLVELKKTQEARSLYIECLALDPNDRKASAELRYLESLN